MPPSISNCRLDPVIDVPNIVIMTMTPGRNHCSDEPPNRLPSPARPDSSGPNSPRNTSGWSNEKISENGSRTIVSVSRHQTWATSVSTPARAGTTTVMPLPPRAGSGRSG
jgi:hypothetical protein